MRILLVEDDHDQAETVTQALEAAFVGTDVQLITSEAAFRQRFSLIAAEPPDLFVIDVMVRWSVPGDTPFYSSPRDSDEPFERAGVRCVELLQNNPSTAAIPVIFYSVLNRVDYVPPASKLPAHYSVVQKEIELNNLILHISSLFPNLVKPKSSFWARLRDSAGASVSWLIFSLDLKKLFSKKSKGA